MRRITLAMTAVALMSCGGDSTTGTATIHSLSFITTSVGLGLHATLRLEAFARDKAGAQLDNATGLTWTSADPTIVSVDGDGNVNGHTLGGPVAVTASANGATATAEVTVTPASLAFGTVPPAFDVGQTFQLVVTPQDALGAPISNTTTTWSTDPVGVVTISPTGLLTAVASGSVDLTATVRGRVDHVTTGVTSVYDGVWTANVNPTVDNPNRVITAVVRVGTVVSVSYVEPRLPCYTLRVSATGTGRINNSAFTFGVPTNGTFSGTFTSPMTLDAKTSSALYGAVTCDDGSHLSGFAAWGGWTVTMTKLP